MRDFRKSKPSDNLLGSREAANLRTQLPIENWGLAKDRLFNKLGIFNFSLNIKRNISFHLSTLAAKIVINRTKGKKVCIFSNDCWGAEFYRCTNRLYNTPFVGLMLMAPCYIKFLENPKYYVEQNLNFIERSKYQDIQKLREDTGPYPIGIIDDIEIHFLHYKNSAQAHQKWNSRKLRIDWDHLYVKFAMDKDYASKEILHVFESLPYKNKVSFSKDEYISPVNIKLTNYVENGAQMFTRCFKQVDMLHWFDNGRLRKPVGGQYFINLFISRFLKIS